jgi:hypothetical protein
MQMNIQTSPCTLVRAIKVLDYFIGEKDGQALVKDIINGEVFNAWLSDIRSFKYQGEELLLITGEV